MGMIATLTVNLDCLEFLSEETFGLPKRIRQAIARHQPGQMEEVGRTSMYVIGKHHADYAELVVMGGEQEGKYLGVSAHFGDKNVEESLLRQLAEKHGYTLHKKPRRKR